MSRSGVLLALCLCAPNVPVQGQVIEPSVSFHQARGWLGAITTMLAITLAGPTVALGQEPDRAAAAPGVAVTDNVLIASGSADASYFEVSLAVDPVTPGHLYSATMRSLPGGVWSAAVFESYDAGRSWTEDRLPWREGADHTADPWAVFAPDGTLYLAYLVVQGDDMDVVIFRREPGADWALPVEVPAAGALHKPSLAVGPALPGTNGHVLYVSAIENSRIGNERSSAVYLTSSRDGARTFADPMRLVPNNLIRNVSHAAVVHPDGSVIVPYMEYAAEDANGTRFLDVHRLWTVATDAGGEYRTPRLAADDALGFFPSLAVDNSEGPNRGRVYLSWSGHEERDPNI